LAFWWRYYENIILALPLGLLMKIEFKFNYGQIPGFIELKKP